MSNSNLGLNRKISSIVSKNLTDTESDIYKQISEIASEYTVEEDPMREYVITKIETGEGDTDLLSEIKVLRNDFITHVTENTFKKFVNLEEIYLPNCTDVDSYGFACCKNLKILDLA